MKFKIAALKQFTVMPNYHLQDKRISLEAKGLLSTFFYLPNDWDYNMKGLCTITKTGIKKMRGILFELELFGYLTRTKTRNEKGQIDYEYTIRVKPKNFSFENTEIWKKLQQKKQ